MGQSALAPRWWLILASALAAVSLLTGTLLMAAGRSDVIRESTSVDGIPVTLVRPIDAGQPDLPAVVLAHGFAGSGEIMDPLASALAGSGTVVAVPDLRGHGANGTALPLGSDGAIEYNRLAQEITAVADWLGSQPGVDESAVALVGHSMGAGAVTRAALLNAGAETATGSETGTATEGRDYVAVVALSLPSADSLPDGQPSAPRNLLLLWGSAEPERFVIAAQEALIRGYPEAESGMDYGSFSAGTARAAYEIDGAEHISILWQTDTAVQTARWLAAASEAVSARPVRIPSTVDPRMLALGLILFGVLLALIPLTRLLLGNRRVSRVSAIPAWRAVSIMVVATLVAATVATLAAPVTALVPLAVGGYLAVWLSASAAASSGLAALGKPGIRDLATNRREVLAALALAGWTTVGLLLPSSLSWAPVAFVGPRFWLAPLFLGIFLVWFVAEELLVRRPTRAARAGLMVVSRALLVGGLLAAVAVLNAPGFLTLLLPLMIPLLMWLGAAGWIVAGRTRSILAPALVQAVPAALIVATTFPLIAG